VSASKRGDQLPAEAVQPAHGLHVWFAIVGPIAAWMVHLVVESSLARVACTHQVTWVLHVITLVLALVVVWAMAISWSLFRDGESADEASSSPLATTRFLGLLGLLLGGINLLLILAEGANVLFISACS
jgi:hypothetical protein